MDKFSLYAAQFVTFKEYFAPKGHNACAGCGVALAVRHIYKALEDKQPVIEKAEWQIPWENKLIAGAEAEKGGLQPSLLTIAKQNSSSENKLYICFDNESSDSKTDAASLLKRLPAVATAGGIAYVATACPSHPFDLIEKARNAWDADGDAFLYILCPCPVGWGFDPMNTVRIGRMAVESRVFPLYDIAQGYYHITVDEPNPRPVRDYIKAQDRFSKWTTKKISALQDAANSAFAAVSEKAVKSV